eukprot:2767724-Rhodomonas_salina.2
MRALSFSLVLTAAVLAVVGWRQSGAEVRSHRAVVLEGKAGGWPVAVKRVNEELAKERNEVKVRCQDTREDDSVGVACSLNCLRQLSTCIDDVTSLSPSVKPR